MKMNENINPIKRIEFRLNSIELKIDFLIGEVQKLNTIELKNFEASIVDEKTLNIMKENVANTLTGIMKGKIKNE